MALVFAGLKAPILEWRERFHYEVVLVALLKQDIGLRGLLPRWKESDREGSPPIHVIHPRPYYEYDEKLGSLL